MKNSFHVLKKLMLLPFLGLATLAAPALDQATVPRSANTCADPTLARTVFQGFSGSSLSHILRFHSGLVNINTLQIYGLWISQGPVFKAWPSQQPSTLPLFQLSTPTLSDYVFMVGADAQTPPIVSGFNANGIAAWVYNTEVCGSVPLMSAVFAAQSDHYYTIDPKEHAELLALGWADSGVVAYVLPLPTS